MENQVLALPLWGGPVAYLAVDEAPLELLAADINGDGAPDLVTTTQAGEVGPSVSVLMNDGDGGFAEEERTVLDRLRYVPQALAAADFGGSGDADLLVAADDVSLFPPRSVLLRLVNDGSADFSEVRDTPLDGLFPMCLVVANLLGDATPEVMVCHSAANGRGLLTVLGAATNGALGKLSDSPVGISPNAAAVGDLDLDGHADVVVTDNVRGSVYVLYGTGLAGPLADSVSIADVDDPTAVAIVRLPSPALPAVIVTSASNGVAMVQQSTSRVFRSPVYVSPSAALGLAVGDVDGDSLADLAVLGTTASVSVLIGVADGGFQMAEGAAVDATSVGLALVDVDSDGRLDLATVSSLTDRVSLLRQVAPTPTRTPTRSASPSPTATASATVRLTTSPVASTPTASMSTPTPSPRPTPAAPGDANCDGMLGAGDVDHTLEMLFHPPFCTGADANLDGAYSAADVPAVVLVLDALE